MVTAQKLMKQDLAKVHGSTTVSDAAKIMRDRKIGSIFVEHNQQIVGIVTETDIVRQIVSRDQMPGFVPVVSIMSSPVIGIEASRPITEAADLMERNQTRHLAVMKAGDIVGVLSVRDLLHPVSIDEF